MFTLNSHLVMPGLSRPKDVVASLAYVPGIHVLSAGRKIVDGRDEPGHDGFLCPIAHHLWISVPVPWLVKSSSSTACCILPSMMTTPCTPCSSA